MKSKLNAKQLALIFSIVYFASYVTRINFAAIIQSVVSDTGYLKSDLSLVLVVLSITYGIGQIINGIISDKISPKIVITIGLSLACFINLLFPLLSSSITLMCILWGINGFAQAMLWPPIVKIMVTTLTEKEYNDATTKVIKSSSIGTIFVYVVSPLIISLLSWKYVFILSALIGSIALIIWLTNQKRIDLTINNVDIETKEISKKLSLPKMVIFPLIFICISIILQGMLRDGITAWMPTYLVEVYSLKEELSILVTLSQAVLTLLSLELFSFIYRKIFKNEVLCASVIFLFVTIITTILLFTYNVSAITSTILMALIIGSVHGINLMLVCYVPKRFKKYGNVSTLSGIINSFTYVGAAISTYGIAYLVETKGWNITILIWLIVALLGFVACFIIFKKWRRFYQQ